MLPEFELFDVVSMKKPHACGTNEWTIIRVGADVKIKCNRCGRIVMMDRGDFVRMGKKVLIPHTKEIAAREQDDPAQAARRIAKND